MRRLVAIGFIWLGCALAWVVLGSTIVHRSGETSGALLEEVRLLWGPPISQSPPTAWLADDEPREAPTAAPAAATITGPAKELAPLAASNLDVSLTFEDRKKGLLWFPTYGVRFVGRYAFVNPSDRTRTVTMSFPLAGSDVVYDAFSVLDGTGKPVDAAIADGQAVWSREFGPRERRDYRVEYLSRGTRSWHYAPPQGTSKVESFELELSVDTPAVDFPAGTISPSTHSVDGGTWRGVWSFDSLVSSAPIGIELPQKLNPGPVASRITFFAPVSLLFFFFVVAILAAARGKGIHPMNYFLLGCAFFAFHLLFAYLVDHVAVFTSFGISAVVSVLLVTSYARLFVGWRFALLDIGVAQLVYLVLFSFTFFWQGFTGLAITIGAVATLFVIMQITGRLDWSEAMSLWRKDAREPALR